MSPRAAAGALVRFGGQVLLYGLFAAAIGYFSTSPAYTHLAPDEAVIKVSFSHTAQRVGECRRRSDEELSALPPNMRIREDCPRERAPVIVEVSLDGALLDRAVLPASGLSRDGAASLYRRFTVPAGEHRIAARLSDRADGAFGYQREERVRLEPAQVLVVEFHAAGGFRFLHAGGNARFDRD